MVAVVGIRGGHNVDDLRGGQFGSGVVRLLEGAKRAVEALDLAAVIQQLVKVASRYGADGGRANRR